MRIISNKPVTGVQSRSTKKPAASGGVFSPDIGGEEDVAQAHETGGGAGIQGIDALLAIQEVDDKGDRKRKAARHGHSLLDSLDSIRADLLAGQVSQDRLEHLAIAVEKRQDSGDPEIDGVLEEIELRVKVELAKLGRFPEN